MQTAYALRAATHPEFPLVTLNYSQIDSPKRHPIVRECRGLVLEIGTWNVVGRSFPRFFAWGEDPECDALFDWSTAVAHEKHDGSLVMVYKYGGRLFINTRGSFGHGPIQKGHPLSWETVFLLSLVVPQGESQGNAFEFRPKDVRARLEEHLPDGFTAVFELCSEYNRVVRDYPTTRAYLLAVFDNATGVEFGDELCDEWADKFNAQRPHRFRAESLATVRRMADRHADPTFEGYVVCDAALRRKKIKNGRYTALHRIQCGVEPALSPKSFAPFLAVGHDDGPMLSPEASARPLVALLGADAHHYYAARGVVHAVRQEMLSLWDAHSGEPDQKTFAQAVAKSPAKAFLFEARKRKCHPSDVWAERGEHFLAGWLPSVMRDAKPTVLTPACTVE